MKHEREQTPGRIQLEAVVQQAQEVVLRDGYHVPTLIVEGSRHLVIVQITGFADTPEGRAQQMVMTGATLAADRSIGTLKQVFFITEAWLSIGRQPPRVPPSKDPARNEVLMVSRQNAATGETTSILREMARDEEGKLAELRDLAFSAAGVETSESPLLDAFVHGFSGGRRGY